MQLGVPVTIGAVALSITVPNLGKEDRYTPIRTAAITLGVAGVAWTSLAGIAGAILGSQRSGPHAARRVDNWIFVLVFVPGVLCVLVGLSCAIAAAELQTS